MLFCIYHASGTGRIEVWKITIKTLPFYQHTQKSPLIWKFHLCQTATEIIWKGISSKLPSFSIFYFLWTILIKMLSTYIWNKTNFIKVVTQLWIMECNHLGKHCQVFWNNKQIQDHWQKHKPPHAVSSQLSCRKGVRLFFLIIFFQPTTNQQVTTTAALFVSIIFNTEEGMFNFSSSVLHKLDFQQWFTWFILRLLWSLEMQS